MSEARKLLKATLRDSSTRSTAESGNTNHLTEGSEKKFSTKASTVVEGRAKRTKHVLINLHTASIARGVPEVIYHFLDFHLDVWRALQIGRVPGLCNSRANGAEKSFVLCQQALLIRGQHDTERRCRGVKANQHAGKSLSRMLSVGISKF